jgi:hypothetical protein
MKYLTSFFFGLIVMALSLVASAANKPSEKTMSEAISRAPSGYVMGKIVQIKSVEILQVGIFNQKNNYWPVKARVKGTRGITGVQGAMRELQFDDTNEYEIIMDDYGKWTANLK